MTSHHPIFRAAAAVVLVVLAPLAAAQQPKGKGVAVVFDGRVAQAAAKAYEFRDIKFENGGFTLIPLPGQVGPRPDREELLHYVDYRHEHNQALLNKMQALAKKFPKAAAPLAPYMAGVRQSIDNKAKNAAKEIDRLPALPAVDKDVLAQSLMIGGVTYFSVRPSSFKQGRIGFFHRDGNFSIPAELLTEEFLLRVAKASPALAKDVGFRGLMNSFAGKATIRLKEYTGIRLLKQNGTQFSLATDQGRIEVDSAKLDKQFVTRLQIGAAGFYGVVESFHLAREKQKAEQTQHEVIAEADRRRQELELATIDAETMKQITEEAARKLEVENRRKMDDGAKWALGLGALLLAFSDLGGGGMPAPTGGMSEADWDRARASWAEDEARRQKNWAEDAYPR